MTKRQIKEFEKYLKDIEFLSEMSGFHKFIENTQEVNKAVTVQLSQTHNEFIDWFKSL